MKILEPLYAYDSSGRIKTWEIQTLDKLVKATVVVKSGLLNGKLTSKSTDILSGKNIGKANQTTPLEQANSEAQSKWAKKKKEGYKSLSDLDMEFAGLSDGRNNGPIYNKIGDNSFQFYGLEEILKKYLPKTNTDDNGALQPMKAQKYWKDDAMTKARIPFPCYIQPKINGVRCFAHIKKVNEVCYSVKLLSKKGLEYPILIDIRKELERLALINKAMIPDEFYLDGELYIDNTILSEITSAVRSLSLMTQSVKFHCFDVAIPSKMDMVQRDRLTLVFNLISTYRKNYISTKIQFVETKRAFTQNDVDANFETYLQFGYEGLIARAPLATYKFGQRPQTMTKLKKRESKEFEIVDVIDSDHNPDIAIFVCRNDMTTETFKVNPEGSVAQKKQYYKDRLLLIGKWLTVEFYERTNTDLPFHAVGITIRDYE
jgi:DNA ligase-1